MLRFSRTVAKGGIDRQRKGVEGRERGDGNKGRIERIKSIPQTPPM